MRCALFLFCFFSSICAYQEIDVAAMLQNILPVVTGLEDLPDAPIEGVVRNSQSITVTDGTTPITVTVTIPNNICGGTQFQVVATITNATGGATGYTVTSMAGLIPTSPDITYVSSTASVGTFVTTGSSAPCPNSGTGTWTIGMAVPAGTTFTLTVTCAATPVGASVAINNDSNIITTIPSTNCIANTAEINPTPVANNYTNTVCNNSALVSTLTETGGTPPFIFSIITPPPASQGTLTITNPNTGAFQFTPDPSFSGVATFTFHVVDSNGCVSNTATGNITVNPAPTAMPFSVTTCSDFVISGSLAPLVSGGTPPYMFAVVGTPVGGTVALNPVTGDFVFTKTGSAFGSGSFTYSATDSHGCVATNTATFIFSTPVPNPYVTAFQIIYAGFPCS